MLGSYGASGAGLSKHFREMLPPFLFNTENNSGKLGWLATVCRHERRGEKDLVA